MARSELEIKAGLARFVELANTLRKVDEDLPKHFRKMLRDVASPIMKKQRRRLRSMPSSDAPDDEPLRDIIAKGLRLTVRTGGGRYAAAYRIRTTMPRHAEGEHWLMLPRGLDTSFNGWRSPFFGQTNNWVHHHASGSSWFMAPAQDGQKYLEVEVDKILAMSIREIAASARKADNAKQRRAYLREYKKRNKG